MIEIEYEEGKKISENCVCGVCGSPLILCWGGNWGIESYVLRCAKDDNHRGFTEVETYTQAMRRGEVVHPAIQAAIERKMLPKDEMGRALNLLALRYPQAIVDHATAALFIMDCVRLDLDPLISPAEAVPIPFKSRKVVKGVVEEKVTVQMVITEDGWLSMAARGCPERWAGAPSVEMVNDPDLAESLCGDKEAWLWKATGRTKDMEPGQTTSAYGYYTHKEWDKIKDKGVPAASQPGNQARVRAIKRWVRENFPDCRQNMMDITAEWYQRAEGVKMAQEYIDSEYQLMSPTKGGEKFGGQLGKGAVEGKSSAKNFAPPKEGKKPVARGASAEAAKVEGESFHIDLTWLKETLKELKWTSDTAKTFLVGKYKASPTGTLEDTIKRLSRDQAEEFVRELQNRVAQKQMDLWG